MASAADGTRKPRAILFDGFPVANSSNTPVTITTREAEVNPAELTWPSCFAACGDTAEWTNQLAKFNITLGAGRRVPIRPLLAPRARRGNRPLSMGAAPASNGRKER